MTPRRRVSSLRSLRPSWVIGLAATFALSIPIALASAAIGPTSSTRVAVPNLPAYDISVPAENTSNDAVAAAENNDDQAGLWFHDTSPVTPTVAPDAQHSVGRVIDTWNQPVTWMVARFLIKDASDWPAQGSGLGSILNLHNVAGDQMTPDGRGIGWGYGSGVSPFHLAVGGYQMPALQPFVHLEYTPNGKGNSGSYDGLLPMVQPGNVYTTIIRIQWGRTDYGLHDSMPTEDRRPGELEVWASPDPSKPLAKVIDLSNANTLIRAQRPSDGAWIIQRYVDGWDGGPYILRSTRENGGDKIWKHVQWATQYGATLGQALSDVPVPVGNPNGQHSVHKAGAYPDLGDAHATAVSASAPGLLLPADLEADAEASAPSLPTAIGDSPPSQAGSGGDASTLSGMTAVVAPTCGGCKAVVGNGTVSATIVGGLDGSDTAYGQADFGGPQGWSKRVYVRDAFALPAGYNVTGNLAVTQVHDVRGNLVYELYVSGADRTLRVWSPPGGLQAVALNLSTNVKVPTDGTPLTVEVAALRNDSLTVRVNGATRLSVTGFTGATTGNQRYLRAGVDHYDTGGSNDGLTVSHSALGATTQGWLGGGPSVDTPETTDNEPSSTPKPATDAGPGSGGDEEPVTGLASVVGAACGACRANVGAGTVAATIVGGRDGLDTAYGQADFGGPAGWAGRVFTRDTIALPVGSSVAANLAVTQVRDTSGALVYELYVAGADRTLRLWGPAGGLRASAINASTGVVVPRDGSGLTVEVSALRNDSVIVRVNGSDRLTLTGLSGASTGNPRYFRAGVDHYDTDRTNDGVSVNHSGLAVSTKGWIGTAPAAPTTSTTSSTTTTAASTTTAANTGPASQPSPSPAPAPAASSGPTVSALTGFNSVVDDGCGACRVSAGSGSVSASIGGGRDDLDTAYGEADFGGSSGWSGRVFTRDTLTLASGTHLSANLSVLQVRDTSGSLVYELYVAGADGTLRLWSPDGGLRSSEINESTGVVAPTNGSSVTVEVSALCNDSVIVRVNGSDRITITGLSGASTGNQRYLRAGIDHYDTDGTDDGVSIQHAALGASASNWLN